MIVGGGGFSLPPSADRHFTQVASETLLYFQVSTLRRQARTRLLSGMCIIVNSGAIYMPRPAITRKLIISAVPRILAKRVKFLAYIRQVPVSNVAWDTDCIEIYRGYSQYIRVNGGIVSYTRPLSSPITSLSKYNHHLMIQHSYSLSY